MSMPRQTRDDYRHFQAVTTRWMDNDIYGHVNNVVYYSDFDTVVNAYLIGQGVLDPTVGETIGLVVESQCNYFAPLSFPDRVTAACAWRGWAAPACATRGRPVRRRGARGGRARAFHPRLCGPADAPAGAAAARAARRARAACRQRRRLIAQS